MDIIVHKQIGGDILFFKKKQKPWFWPKKIGTS